MLLWGGEGQGQGLGFPGQVTFKQRIELALELIRRRSIQPGRRAPRTLALPRPLALTLPPPRPLTRSANARGRASLVGDRAQALHGTVGVAVAAIEQISITQLPCCI